VRRLTGGVVVLFARSRRLDVLAGAAVLVVVAGVLLPLGVVGVPSGSVPRAAVPLVLVPFALSGAWTTCVVPPSAVLERFVAPARMRLRRAAWYAFGTAVLTVAAALPVLVVRDAPDAAVVVVRNVLLGVALATLSGCVLPRRTSWLPLLVVVLVCWLFGTVDGAATAAVWALPNHAADAPLAAAVTVVGWCGAGLRYVLADGYDDAD